MAKGEAAGAEPEPGAGDPGVSEQPPAGYRVGQPTSDGTFESDSASASTCWESSWVCFALSVS